MNLSLSNTLGKRMAINPDGLSLDLAFAADKTLTARKGPTPTFTRASTATFVGSNGLIQSAAIDEARFDHDPVTGVCRGLLIEEARTNLITFSESIANGAWASFLSATATDNQTTSPSGVAASATRLTAVAGTSTIRSRVRLLTISTGGTAFSASAFIKAGTSNFGFVSMAFNKSGVGAIRNCGAHIVFSTGVITKIGASNADFAVTSIEYPDDWYKITISATSNASLAVEDQVVLSVGLSFDGVGGSGVFAGTETVFAWGAQLEIGAFPTSYIPTTTAALTRSADVCSVTTAGWSNAGNDTMLASYFVKQIISGAVLLEGGLSLSWMSIAFTTNNRQRNIYRHGDSSIRFDAVTPNNTVSTTSINKTILTSGEQLALNGSLTQTVSGDPPQADISTSLNIGRRSDFGGGASLNGHIARIQYFRKRLPNAKLITLTT